LAGLKVRDLSRVLAGPWSSQLLGDLGADVVKVERPGSGDDVLTGLCATVWILAAVAFLDSVPIPAALRIATRSSSGSRPSR